MSKHYAIGVDLGGTSLRAALVSRKGEIKESLKVSSGGDVMSSLDGALKGLMTDGVVGVGIGVAGLIDRAEGRVLTSPNLPELDGRAFKDDLELKVPLYVENDADCAAMGENWLGAGRGLKSFVMLTLGTGVGCSFFQDGHIVDIEAEAGHMVVVAQGEPCPCGNRGCLELYASAQAIKNAAVRALQGGSQSALGGLNDNNFYKLTPQDIYKAALEGDTLARELLKEAGKYLGVGISNLINLLSPRAVILAGGLTGAWGIYVEEAVREARRRALKGLVKDLDVLPSAFKEGEGGVLGAAALVLDEKASRR